MSDLKHRLRRKHNPTFVEKINEKPFQVPVNPDGAEAAALIESQAERIKALEAENGKLLNLVKSAETIFMHCSVTDGMCCCGDNMETHSDPMICGHSPVDHGDYQVSLWFKENNLRHAASLLNEQGK